MASRSRPTLPLMLTLLPPRKASVVQALPKLRALPATKAYSQAPFVVTVLPAAKRMPRIVASDTGFAPARKTVASCSPVKLFSSEENSTAARAAGERDTSRIIISRTDRILRVFMMTHS